MKVSNQRLTTVNNGLPTRSSDSRKHQPSKCVFEGTDGRRDSKGTVDDLRRNKRMHGKCIIVSEHNYVLTSICKSQSRACDICRQAKHPFDMRDLGVGAQLKPRRIRELTALEPFQNTRKHPGLLWRRYEPKNSQLLRSATRSATSFSVSSPFVAPDTVYFDSSWIPT